MATITRWRAPPGRCGERWSSIGAFVRAALEAREIPLRDAIVLVPFAALLPEARRAFSAGAGFMPRIETARTLAASLGPPPTWLPGALSFDAATDGLVAEAMLAGQPWGAEWRRRDRRAFVAAARRLAATATSIAEASFRVAPEARGDWQARVRATLVGATGPGQRERALARVAFEWSLQSATPASDALFTLEPRAWVAIVAGGDDDLALRLLERSKGAAIVVDCDPDLDASFAVPDPESAPALAVCDSFEDEAESAAAQVLAHLDRDERPVALIAADRVLVRRVRALLEPSGARLLDETGWTLSTTRAAATVMSLLVAARDDATSDAFFEWLKGATRWLETSPASIVKLEAVARRASAWRLAALATLVVDDPVARRHRDEALGVLAALRAEGRRPLSGWLDAFASALDACGALAGLRADAAGRQVLDVLGLGDVAARRRWATDATLSLPDFTHWLDHALEAAVFRPPMSGVGDAEDARGQAAADVIVTPLARATLRPFAAAVVPGADHRSLGALGGDDDGLGADARAAIGIVDAAARRRRERLAFAHLLAVPRVTFLRRRSDGSETFSTSSFVESLALDLASRGRSLGRWHDPRAIRHVEPAPVERRGAVAGSRVPSRVSASAYEALRVCPYRYFARSLLRLRSDDELDGEIGPPDYGLWLHDVLHAFHAGRVEPRPAARDATALREAGESSRAKFGLDAGDFLPWSAAFEALVPRYVAWLHERDGRGLRWQDGELELSVAAPGLDGIELHGTIDRVDVSVAGQHADGVEVIDYKTGSKETLRERVRERQEDTQLAFYAALLERSRATPVARASYLALDARPALQQIEHAGVAESAATLVEGIASDLARVRGGAALLPLGEGTACDYCEARGLCRRDHWARAPEPRP